MPLEPGYRLGRYEIQSLLGTGGMGEVYLAHDSRLNRKVALKVLGGQWTADEARLRRFAQEARAASALNHPNIVTVYDVDLDGDTQFITTEFIEGETLRARLRRGHMPVPEALRIATEVGDALAAAHREGIVHRDIKPENILLRPDGYVKVVDFGLAKLTEGSADDKPLTATQEAVETSIGVILGTVAYMSPEQARGLPVDPRTDVWSLGVVLYEMIAERRPFDGPTSTDVLAAILHKDPSNLAAFARDVTGEVELIVETALAKNADERYQTARDLVNVLKRVRKHVDTETARQRALSPAPRPRIATRSVALLLTILLGAAVYGVYRYLGRDRGSPRVESFGEFQIARLTASSRVLDAAISPDGRYVVHTVDDGPGQSLWVRHVNTNANIQVVPSANVVYIGLTFSKDGDYIYYVSRHVEQRMATLFHIPVLGGTPRKVIDDVDTPVTFSPDGSRLAFIRGYADGMTSVVVSNADGTAEQRLATMGPREGFATASPEQIGPSWSPDGAVIASAIDHGDDRRVEIAVVDVHNGQMKTLASGSWYMVRRLGWLADGSGLVAAAAEKSSAYSGQQIWRISYPAGAARRITNDLSNYGGVSVTAAGRAFVSTQTSTSAELMVAPREDPSAVSVLTPSKTTFDGRFGLSWTYDDDLLYSSRTGGTFDLWMMKADGSSRRPVLTNAGASIWPDVSHDGKTVVLNSDRGADIFHVWRVGIDGTGMRPLTKDDTSWYPKVLADDSVIYSARDRIWRVSLSGGDARPVTNKSTSRPALSPDGSQFVCSYREEPTARPQLAVYQVGGTEPRRIFDIPVTADTQAQWGPDGRSLHYVDTIDGVSNIWSLNLAGGPASQVTHFKNDRIFAFAWSRDGTQLALSRGAMASDAVLITSVH